VWSAERVLSSLNRAAAWRRIFWREGSYEDDPYHRDRASVSMEHHSLERVSGEEEEGRGQGCCGNGRGSWGAPICTSGSGNDGELKGIREEVSSWLYVSFCSGVRVREWRRRRSS
jgi:hypothetical protein